MALTPDDRIVQARRKRPHRAKMVVDDDTPADPLELAAMEATLEDTDFPPQVIIEVTNACNLRCEMCAHRLLTRRFSIMPEDLWNRIVEEIAAEQPETRVWFSFYGEALLAKDRLWTYLKRARAVGLTQLILNTNGMMLDDRKIDHLMHDGPSCIVFSIDGLSREVYERFRTGARHEQVYANARKAIEAARGNGNYPEIVVQIIDMPGTRHEIPDFIKYWNDLGAVVKVKNLVTWTGAALDRSACAVSRITCPWGMTTFPITAIGEALLCGADFDARMPIGNVRQHTIKALWAKHSRYRRIQVEKRWDDLPELCKGCTDWQTAGARTYYPDGRRIHLRDAPEDAITVSAGEGPGSADNTETNARHV